MLPKVPIVFSIPCLAIFVNKVNSHSESCTFVPETSTEILSVSTKNERTIIAHSIDLTYALVHSKPKTGSIFNILDGTVVDCLS